MSDERPVAGIDLGGTHMQIGIVGADGALLGRASQETHADRGLDAVLDRIAAGVKEACGDAGIGLADLAGAGIGAPGAVDPGRGVVLTAVNLRWTDVPLGEMLRERLGIHIVVDNDVNSAVLGEQRLGAARGMNDVFGAWIGTGVGSGLVLNGQLYQGHFHTAGEFGHTILLPGSPLGARTVEQNCSRTAIVDRLCELIEANHQSMLSELVGGELERIGSRDVAKAYEAGDELTRQVVGEAAKLLGTAISNVGTLLSLECVVLGGGFSEALGRAWVDAVGAAYRSDVFPDRCQETKFVLTELDDRAGLMGAAMLARERLGGA